MFQRLHLVLKVTPACLRLGSLEEQEEVWNKGLGTTLDLGSSAQTSGEQHAGRKWPICPFHGANSPIQNERRELPPCRCFSEWLLTSGA